jgi:small subunit ribosomal protein S17
LYKKRFVVKKKYYAHDENNISKVGDTVKIRSTKPMSKLKRWLVVEKM